MKIIQVENQNFLENLIATIVTNEYKDYGLMLSKSWGVDFNDCKESVGKKYAIAISIIFICIENFIVLKFYIFKINLFRYA